jgi:Fe-Mn family superoxide dismutase
LPRALLFLETDVKRKATGKFERRRINGGKKMTTGEPYKARKFNLSGLNGISDETLELHFKLYEGYVKETNTLIDEIRELEKTGRVNPDETPIYSSLKYRLGFEYNGVVLHELYFDNLTKSGNSAPETRSQFRAAAEGSFGTYDRWQADFVAVGSMRGVGWAICYHDPIRNQIVNQWITLHETGHLAGFNPLLVMDVWEHAYLLDYKPSDRGKYIEAFFSNVAWNVVEDRLKVRQARAQEAK